MLCEISGGDLDIYDKIPEVYRQSSPKDFITGGDVRQYVQQDENGVPYVDLTYLNDLLSDEFKFVKDQHAALKKKVSKLTGKKKKQEATQELKKMIMSVVNSKKRGSPSVGDAPANTVNLRTLMNQAKQMKKEVIVKADGSYHFQ